jgi:ABC-type glycerol-3-phosphate transport system substrate-binding protein
MLKKMRWTDNSMGANFDYGWSDINQAFAAGNVGMYISGSDVYTNLVSASNIDPSIYGLAPIPLAKSSKAVVLGGGTLAAVRPDANAAARAAAVK